MNFGSAPSPDQLELTLFGPGYGESIILHIGSGRWIVIDSCYDSATSTPAALSYLKSIGVEYANVELIVATHWHDDHIRGISQLFQKCPNADFCCSSALTADEFIATIAKFF